MPTNAEGKYIIPKLDKYAIQTSYNSCIKYAARLLNFSVALPTNVPELDDIENKQNELAVEDIIFFSLSLRRLLNNIQVGKKLGETKLLCYITDKNKNGIDNINIITIINKIIHHKNIYIVRSGLDLISYSPDDIKGFLEKYEKGKKEKKPPHIYIKTNNKTTIYFRLYDLIVTSGKDIISIASDYCSDHGLYLENYDI